MLQSGVSVAPASLAAAVGRKRPRAESSVPPSFPEMSSPARIFDRSFAVRRCADPETGKRGFSITPITCTSRLRPTSTVAATYLMDLPPLPAPPSEEAPPAAAAPDSRTAAVPAQFPYCGLQPTLIVHCHVNGLCILTIGDLLSCPSPSSHPWSVSAVEYASHIKTSVDTAPAGKGKANKKKYDAKTGEGGADNSVRSETVVCRIKLKEGGEGGKEVVVPITACVEGVVIEYNEALGTEEGRRLLKDDPMGSGFLAIIKPKYKFPPDDRGVRLPRKEWLRLKQKEKEEGKGKKENGGDASQC